MHVCMGLDGFVCMSVHEPMCELVYLSMICPAINDLLEVAIGW